MLEKFKVEIEDTTVRMHDAEPNEKTGEVKTYPTQVAYLHQPGAKYPTRFRLYLPKDRKGQPYPVGMYTIDPESAFVNYGKLQFSLNKLIPIAAGVQAARAS